MLTVRIWQVLTVLWNRVEELRLAFVDEAEVKVAGTIPASAIRWIFEVHLLHQN